MSGQGSSSEAPITYTVSLLKIFQSFGVILSQFWVFWTSLESILWINRGLKVSRVKIVQLFDKWSKIRQKDGGRKILYEKGNRMCFAFCCLRHFALHVMLAPVICISETKLSRLCLLFKTKTVFAHFTWTNCQGLTLRCLTWFDPKIFGFSCRQYGIRIRCGKKHHLQHCQ